VRKGSLKTAFAVFRLPLLQQPQVGYLYPTPCFQTASKQPENKPSARQTGKHAMSQTVTLVPYDPAHAADLDYRLHGEQAQYSVSPQERLQNGRFAAPDCLAVTILCQNRPIGFFILDKGSDRLTYSTNPRAVLLRSMSVNPAYQGQGCARAALADDKLAPLIRSILPDCDEIVFGVHHANRAAIGLYQSCGFADTGRTFMGTKGLQYIYSKTIR